MPLQEDALSLAELDRRIIRNLVEKISMTKEFIFGEGGS